MIKKADVVITYKNSVINIKGPGIDAEVLVSTSELKKMYWGKAGRGSVTVTIADAPVPPVVK